jgi:hypothetical protein
MEFKKINPVSKEAARNYESERKVNYGRIDDIFSRPVYIARQLSRMNIPYEFVGSH